MRPGTMKRRGGRAVLALLVGLLAGAWIGGGLVWITHRHEYSDPETVLNVNLGKADEVEMVPANAIGFAHVRLRDLWKTEAMTEFRKVLEQAGPEALKALDEGFLPAPSTIERATVVVIPGEPPRAVGGAGAGKEVAPPPGAPDNPPRVEFTEAGPAQVFAILAFTAPFDPAAVRQANLPTAAKKQAGGKDYWQDGANGIAVHFPNDRVIVIGTGQAVPLYLSTPSKKEGPLAPAIGLASRGERHLVTAVNMALLPASIRGQIDSTLPTEAKTILRADTMAIGMVIDRGMKLDLRAGYKDEEAAQNAEKAIRTATDEGRKKLAEVKKKMEEQIHGKAGSKKPRPVDELPGAVGGLFALGAINILDAWLADPHLERQGKEVSASATMPTLGNAYMTTTAMSIGMLLPAVQKVREAATRVSDQNNLKLMGLAMHNYHDANLKLPTPSWSHPPGKGGLSWRVALLPYLEHDDLFRQFNLDEPWDSEHNKKLIPQMPTVYMNPRAPTEPGKTYYKVFVGGGAIFDRNPQRTPTFTTIRDGTSNTIMIAEGGEPVIWTKPDDFEFDPDKPLPRLGIPGASGVNVCMADGSVRFINPETVPERTMKLLIRANDGQPIPPERR